MLGWLSRSLQQKDARRRRTTENFLSPSKIERLANHSHQNWYVPHKCYNLAYAANSVSECTTADMWRDSSEAWCMCCTSTRAKCMWLSSGWFGMLFTISLVFTTHAANGVTGYGTHIIQENWKNILPLQGGECYAVPTAVWKLGGVLYTRGIETGAL
jgi:hypothetical protein